MSGPTLYKVMAVWLYNFRRFYDEQAQEHGRVFGYAGGVIMYASPAKSAVCFLPDDDGGVCKCDSKYNAD